MGKAAVKEETFNKQYLHLPNLSTLNDQGNFIVLGILLSPRFKSSTLGGSEIVIVP